jgi:hypothetical protein
MQIGVNVPTLLKPARATRHIKRLLRVPFIMEIIITCAGAYGQREMTDFLMIHTRGYLFAKKKNWKGVWPSYP